jgi:hypothetical protein
MVTSLSASRGVARQIIGKAMTRLAGVTPREKHAIWSDATVRRWTSGVWL